jgi:hypothetical protein
MKIIENLEDLKVGDKVIWHNGDIETIRKIENGKYYISHLCGYSLAELKDLVIKQEI